MLISDKIQFSVLIVTVITVIVTILFNALQSKQLNKQLRLNFFAEYTKRYQEIILSLPIVFFDEQESELTNDQIKYVQLYFDLCSEEYYLYFEESAIDEKVWKNWEEGMKIAFRRVNIQKAWQIIGTTYYDKFGKYVNDKLLS